MDQPEQDGTLSWQKATVVVVGAVAAGLTSLSYTYADGATAKLIEDILAPMVIGDHAFHSCCRSVTLPACPRGHAGAVVTRNLASYRRSSRKFIRPKIFVPRPPYLSFRFANGNDVGAFLARFGTLPAEHRTQREWGAFPCSGYPSLIMHRFLLPRTPAGTRELHGVTVRACREVS